MRGRHRGMGKGARRLAGRDGGIDPALVEKWPGQFGEFGRETGIGVQHGGAGLGPGDDARRLGRQRRVAVPDLQPVQPQPFCLQRVIAVRKARIGGGDGVAQCLDHLGLDMVGQMAAILRRGHLAPLVLDGLFLGQRVVDAGKQLEIVAKDAGQRMGRGLAPGAVMFGQQVQRGFHPQHLAIDLEFQRGRGFVEQPVPGGGADNGIVVQELFQFVGQLVRTHGAHPVEDRLVAGGTVGRGKHGLVGLVRDAVEFKAEEDQRRGDVGDLRLQIAQHLGAAGIGGVLVIAQARIGHQPSGDNVDHLIGLDAVQHGGRIQFGQLALPGGGEIIDQIRKPGQIRRQFRRVGTGIEIAQIPDGQIAETGIGGRFGRIEDRQGGHEHVLSLWPQM